MTDWSMEAEYAKLSGWAEGQQGEGGPNAALNCVPTSFTIVTKLYGGPELEPQDLTNLVYGASYHGGEDYAPIWHVIHDRLWGGLPDLAESNPADTLGAIDAAGVSGHAVICSFWCDGPGNIITSNRFGFVHVSPVVAHRNGVVIVQNVEANQSVALTEADFRAATNGSRVGDLAVFQRNIHMVDPNDPVIQHIEQQITNLDTSRQGFDTMLAKLLDPNFGGGDAWNRALDTRLGNIENAIKQLTPGSPQTVPPPYDDSAIRARLDALEAKAKKAGTDLSS